jgi:shikimate kinase
MTLFLVGYMGSGKSVIGKKLAEVLNYAFLDFDDYIEEKEKAFIATIFETKGEIYFRKVEQTYIKEVLQLPKTVVALGGGTPCYGNTMNMILNTENAQSIYLKASITTLSNRLFDEKAKRPLIAHVSTIAELNEFIGKHIFERAPFYEQSNLIVKTDGKSVEDVVQDLMLQLF